MTMQLAAMTGLLTGAPLRTVESMLANSKFLATDRKWLKSLLTAYIENGALTMTQHKTMGVLLGVAGIRALSPTIFTPRPPAALPTVPEKRPNPTKQADAKKILHKAEAKAKKPKSKAKPRRQTP